MNNIMGGFNNRVNDLFRAELGSVLLSHKAQQHHFNTLSTSSQRCSWREVPQPRPCFLGNSLSGKEQTVRHTMLLLCQSNGEKKIICVVCSTTGTQKKHFALTMQIKQKVKNTQQSMNLIFFLIGLQTFIYPNTVLCFKFTVQSDDLGIISFSIFWSILGAIY